MDELEDIILIELLTTNQGVPFRMGSESLISEMMMGEEDEGGLVEDNFGDSDPNPYFGLISMLEDEKIDRKDYERVLRYQPLPIIDDFPHLEVGQRVEKLQVHEKFVCWTDRVFWSNFRMGRESFEVLFAAIDEQLTVGLNQLPCRRIWAYRLPNYLILAGALMYLGGFKVQGIQNTLHFDCSTFYKLTIFFMFY